MDKLKCPLELKNLLEKFLLLFVPFDSLYIGRLGARRKEIFADSDPDDEQ